MTSITGQPETPPGTTHQEAERAEAAGRGIDEGADESDRLGSAGSCSARSARKWGWPSHLIRMRTASGGIPSSRSAPS